MLRTKQTHKYTYYQIVQHHYTTNTHLRNPQHRFHFINSKYTSPLFLNFTFCIKDTNMQGVIRNYHPISQIYIVCPLTRIFNVDECRPLIVPHKYIQPVEVQNLKQIHNTNYNRKLYNLIQNTPHEFSPSSEEQKIIIALKILWPLLRTKYIIRLLAELLASTDTIHNLFPNRFFAVNDDQ